MWATLLELLEGIAGRSLHIERASGIPGDQRRTKADTTRIREALGWAPQVSLEQGLAAQWEWALGRLARR